MYQPGEAAPVCEDTLRKQQHAGDPDALLILDIRKAYLQVPIIIVIAPELQRYETIIVMWGKVYASVLSTCLTGRPRHSFLCVLFFDVGASTHMRSDHLPMLGNSNFIDDLLNLFSVCLQWLSVIYFSFYSRSASSINVLTYLMYLHD